ncbi:condensation protein [Kitasatospora sp. NPDC089509]|uniref:phthiocerol/phthiodiolone dimycocerosyl transferase family protein n=1 Tax=Kitasatospora sp. NPDC089509 TaxID=3364079 RepID=UPI00382585F7
MSSERLLGRPLSVNESVLAVLEQQVAAAVTLHGPLDLDLLDRAVAHLCEVQPVLAASIVPGEGGLRLEPGAGSTVPQVTVGGGFDTAIGGFGLGQLLLRVTVLPQPDGSHQVVVAVHHAVSDGVSVLALMGALWQAYTVLAGGGTPDVARVGLPEPVQQSLRARHSHQRVEEFLSRRAAFVASVHPAVVPPTVEPESPAARPGSWLNRITVPAAAAARLRELARARSASAHTLLSAALLVATRSLLPPEPAGLTLNCLSAVDLRARLDPPLPPGRIVQAASVAYTVSEVAGESDLLDLAGELRAQLHGEIEADSPELELLASEQAMEHFTTAPITLAVTNLAGRPFEPELPAELSADSLRLFTQPPGPFPLALITSTRRELAIDLALPRRWFGAERADRLTQATAAALTTLLGAPDTVEIALGRPAEQAAGAAR